MAKPLNSRLLVGITALILIFGLFVTVKAWNSNPAPVLTEQWFAYNSNSQDRDDIENPENYTLLEDEPSCVDGAELCAIKADAEPGGQPVLQPTLVNEIMSVIDTRIATQTVKLKN